MNDKLQVQRKLGLLLLNCHCFYCSQTWARILTNIFDGQDFDDMIQVDTKFKTPKNPDQFRLD